MKKKTFSRACRPITKTHPGKRQFFIFKTIILIHNPAHIHQAKIYRLENLQELPRRYERLALFPAAPKKPLSITSNPYSETALSEQSLTDLPGILEGGFFDNLISAQAFQARAKLLGLQFAEPTPVSVDGNTIYHFKFAKLTKDYVGTLKKIFESQAKLSSNNKPSPASLQDTSKPEEVRPSPIDYKKVDPPADDNQVSRGTFITSITALNFTGSTKGEEYTQTIIPSMHFADMLIRALRHAFIGYLKDSDISMDTLEQIDRGIKKLEYAVTVKLSRKEFQELLTNQDQVQDAYLQFRSTLTAINNPAVSSELNLLLSQKTPLGNFEFLSMKYSQVIPGSIANQINILRETTYLNWVHNGTNSFLLPLYNTVVNDFKDLLVAWFKSKGISDKDFELEAFRNSLQLKINPEILQSFPHGDFYDFARKFSIPVAEKKSAMLAEQKVTLKQQTPTIPPASSAQVSEADEPKNKLHVTGPLVPPKDNPVNAQKLPALSPSSSSQQSGSGEVAELVGQLDKKKLPPKLQRELELKEAHTDLEHIKKMAELIRQKQKEKRRRAKKELAHLERMKALKEERAKVMAQSSEKDTTKALNPDQGAAERKSPTSVAGRGVAFFPASSSSELTSWFDISKTIKCDTGNMFVIQKDGVTKKIRVVSEMWDSKKEKVIRKMITLTVEADNKLSIGVVTLRPNTDTTKLIKNLCDESSPLPYSVKFLSGSNELISSAAESLINFRGQPFLTEITSLQELVKNTWSPPPENATDKEEGQCPRSDFRE